MARKMFFLMIKYEDYEGLFNLFDINKKDANSLLDFMRVLAEIGINNFNDKKIEDEELCNMD